MGKRKKSGSPLLDGQFELFTSSVELTNECGMYVPVLYTRSHKSDGFFSRSRPVFIYILRIIRVLYRCSSLIFFYFYAGRLRSFCALICENRSFPPRRIWKKSTTNLLRKKNTKKGRWYNSRLLRNLTDIITLWHNLFDCLTFVREMSIFKSFFSLCKLHKNC